MWNGNDETLRKKKDVTPAVVGAFNNVKGGRLGLMMALSGTCLDEFIRTGKVDGTTEIVDFNYLKDEDGHKIPEQDFRKSQGLMVDEICRSHGIGKPHVRHVFRDVFDTSLNVMFRKEKFDAMYLDSCSQLGEDKINWLNCGATCDAIVDGGIIALTWTLNNRGRQENPNWLESVDAKFDARGILLKGDVYATVESRSKNIMKLCRIRKLVEDGGRWKAVRLIHYNRKPEEGNRGGGHQLATCIFRKIR